MNKKRLIAATAALVVTGSAFAAAPPGDNGSIWLGTDVSYELPSSSDTSLELGFGWYGVGGGFNYYSEKHRSGLMWSARVGYTGGNGVAVNAAVNYVGHFSPSVVWRLGVGYEYASKQVGFYNNFGDTFPFVEAAIGFRL